MRTCINIFGERYCVILFNEEDSCFLFVAAWVFPVRLLIDFQGDSFFLAAHWFSLWGLISHVFRYGFRLLWRGYAWDWRLVLGSCWVFLRSSEVWCKIAWAFYQGLRFTPWVLRLIGCFVRSCWSWLAFAGNGSLWFRITLASIIGGIFIRRAVNISIITTCSFVCIFLFISEVSQNFLDFWSTALI